MYLYPCISFYIPLSIYDLVFEENAFVTKSRANAFTHSLKKRMAAAASVAKAGSGATVIKQLSYQLF